MISVIIPSYNERLTIKDTIENLKKQTSSIDTEIIAVNDGSSDSTLEILRKIKGLKIINHETNKGYGASLKDGILASKGDWILIIDADGTYPPESIPTLLKYARDYDMIIGARTGKNVNIPFMRKPAKWVIAKFANYICEEKIPDLNSGLRLFKKEIAMRFFSLFPEGFSFTTTITTACLTNHYRVKFVPIDYLKRKKESKSSIKPIRDTIGFLSLLFRMSIYFRPLKIFVPVGLILFLGGLAKGTLDFLRFSYVGSGDVMVVLAGLQILFLGFLADLTIKRTKL